MGRRRRPHPARLTTAGGEQPECVCTAVASGSRSADPPGSRSLDMRAALVSWTASLRAERYSAASPCRLRSDAGPELPMAVQGMVWEDDALTCRVWMAWRREWCEQWASIWLSGVEAGSATPAAPPGSSGLPVGAVWRNSAQPAAVTQPRYQLTRIHSTPSPSLRHTPPVHLFILLFFSHPVLAQRIHQPRSIRRFSRCSITPTLSIFCCCNTAVAISTPPHLSFPRRISTVCPKHCLPSRPTRAVIEFLFAAASAHLSKWSSLTCDSRVSTLHTSLRQRRSISKW